MRRRIPPEIRADLAALVTSSLTPRAEVPDAVMRAVRRLPEKAVQRQIVGLLRLLGWQVWVLGTVRRRGDHPGTMQTPGAPDLLCLGPVTHPGLLCVEVKAKGGRLRPDQQRFRDACQAAGVPHVVGGLDDVVRWLEAHGIRTGRQWALEDEGRIGTPCPPSGARGREGEAGKGSGRADAPEGAERRGAR